MNPLRILLVSARPAALQALLRGPDRDIVVAGSAQAAGERVGEAGWGLVLIEEDAPQCDGPALIRDLRAHDPAAACVLLAASGAPEHLLEAWRSGADDCLAPPLDERLLACRLERLIASIVGRQRVEERCSELAEALRTSELFAAVLGHDLRNPLAAIATGAELLLRNQDPAAVLRTAQRMRASTQRMAGMVERLLDVARLRADPARANFERIDLGVLAQRIADEFTRPEHAGRVQVQRTGALDMDADPGALGQALSNLVGNALKHGAAGCPVTLALDGGDADILQVTVHNPGCVVAAVGERATEAFVRREGSQGVGLGLYIVNQMVALHGGRLSLDSSADGGTTATVVLPRWRERCVSESSDTSLGAG